MDRVVSDRPSDLEAFRSGQDYTGCITSPMETAVRKPRDYDAELKALSEKAQALKERKIRQLGELVIATGADALDVEVLAGGLLAMSTITEAGRKDTMRARGAAFFRDGSRGAGDPTGANRGKPAQGGGDAPSGGPGQSAT
jgi:hypothetical protein